MWVAGRRLGLAVVFLLAAGTASPVWAFDPFGHDVIEAAAYRRLLETPSVPGTGVSGRSLLATLLAQGVLEPPRCFEIRPGGLQRRGAARGAAAKLAARRLGLCRSADRSPVRPERAVPALHGRDRRRPVRRSTHAWASPRRWRPPPTAAVSPSWAPCWTTSSGTRACRPGVSPERMCSCTPSRIRSRRPTPGAMTRGASCTSCRGR